MIGVAVGILHHALSSASPAVPIASVGPAIGPGVGARRGSTVREGALEDVPLVVPGTEGIEALTAEPALGVELTVIGVAVGHREEATDGRPLAEGAGEGLARGVAFGADAVRAGARPL